MPRIPDCCVALVIRAVVGHTADARNASISVSCSVVLPLNKRRSMPPLSGAHGPTVLRVKVKPNARESTLVQESTGSWIARVRAAPVRGRANEELIALIAKHFGCPKAAVSIKHGSSGRTKLIQIERR